MFNQILTSKLFLFLILLVLIAITLSVFNVNYKRHLLNKEIDKLKSEIEKLEKENQNLAQIIQYYNSESFLEKEARQKLNLKKEGENVIAVPNHLPNGQAQ